MRENRLRNWVLILLALPLLWFSGRHLLGLSLPFLLGGAGAWLSEPAVRRLSRRLPRGLSAAIGVSLTLVLGLGLISLLGAVALRELGKIMQSLPDVQDMLRRGLLQARDLGLQLARSAPEGLRPLLTQAVRNLTGDGTQLLSRAAARVPGLVGAFMGSVPGSAVTLGTALLFTYSLSARLPRLRQQLREKIPEAWKSAWKTWVIPGKAAVKSWFLAQGKLCLLTFLLCLGGFFLLKVPCPPLWAFFTCLVDAVPMLGTGTVLVPWGIFSLLEGDRFLGAGLLILYGCCSLMRTALEPKLLGRQLGLDPLLTLVCIYMGWRLGGIWGMILLPVLAGGIHSAIAGRK